MTGEEAKKEIEKVFEPAFANYIIKALTDGATESDTPCEDAVSKLRVIEILRKHGEFIFATDTPSYTDMVNEIANLHSVKVEPQEWISVKDRLPKEHKAEEKAGERYLVTYTYENCKGNHICIGIDFCRDGKWQNHSEDVYEHVTAWMPLPSPYKGNEI